MKKKNTLFSATGIPSLFLIFAVLMLVILSLLGYGTSRQNLRASTLSLGQTTAYYNACTEATDFYTSLVHTLKKFQTQVKTEDEYSNRLKQKIDEVKKLRENGTLSKQEFLDVLTKILVQDE